MIGEKESEKLNALSLSNNTVKRRTEDMPGDVLNQIVNQAKASSFCATQFG